jgi:hypothetical protein
MLRSNVPAGGKFGGGHQSLAAATSLDGRYQSLAAADGYRGLTLPRVCQDKITSDDSRDFLEGLLPVYGGMGSKNRAGERKMKVESRRVN